MNIGREIVTSFAEVQYRASREKGACKQPMNFAGAATQSRGTSPGLKGFVHGQWT